MQRTAAPWNVRAAGAALAALWLLPPLLPLAQRPATHFYRGWLAAALGAAATLLWLRCRPARLPVPRSALLLLALGGFILLQALVVPAPYLSPALGYALVLGWAAMLTIAAAGIRDALGSDACLRLIAWSAMLGAVLGAGSGYAQALGVSDRFAALVAAAPPGAVRGNLQHASYFADQLLMGVAAAAFLFARRELSPATAAIAAVWLGCALALAGSRATLGLLPVLLVLAIVIASRAPSAGGVRLTAVMALVLLAMLGAELAVALGGELVPRHGAGASTLQRLRDAPDAGGVGVRLLLWQRALEIFAAHPLLGVGPDGFAWHHYQGAQGPILYTIHAHSLVLQSLACFGIEGAGLLMVMLSAWAWQYRDRALTLEWWPVTAMLAVLLGRAMLDLNVWFVHLLGPAAVLLGVGDRRGGAVDGKRLRVAQPVLPLLAVAFLVWTLHDFRSMASLWAERLPAAEARRRVVQARSNPLFTPLADSILADASPVDARSDAAQLALNARSMHWRPTPRMVWRHSALLALAGAPRQACEALSRARVVYPGYEGRFRDLLDRAGSPAPAALTALRAQLDALAAGASPAAVCDAPAPRS
jgi:O-antigen ligase